MTTIENIDLICAQLAEMGLGNLPAYRRWITESIFADQEKFAIMILADKKQEYFTCAIDCEKKGDDYHLPGMTGCLIPQAIIQHIDYKGISTAELQQRMEKVDWNDKTTSLFFHTLKAAERSLNDAEQFVYDIFRDVHLLMQSGNTQAAGVSLQLQHNFWYGKLFGLSVGMNANVEAFCPVVQHRFDLAKQVFSIEEVYELLNFRPVRKKVYAVPGGESFQWYQLSRRDRGIHGIHPLQSYPDFDLGELLKQLPLTNGTGVTGSMIEELYVGRPLYIENGNRSLMISLDASSASLVIEDLFRNSFDMEIFNIETSKKMKSPEMPAGKKKITPALTLKLKERPRKGRRPDN